MRKVGKKVIRTKKEIGELTRIRIFAYIVGYFDSHGYAPSYKEIAYHCNLKSVSSVHAQIQKLIEVGKLGTDHYGSPRALRLEGYEIRKKPKNPYDVQ